MTAHPLDRPVWNALAGPQRSVSLGSDSARRYRPDMAFFAAAADSSPHSLAGLAALLPESGCLGLAEPVVPTLPAGARIVSSEPCEQRVLDVLTPGPEASGIEPLTEADAPAMLALAKMMRPGPFFANTHRLGGFLGIKHQGRLVAMAGERMKLEGFAEVSGVCTHPDFGGRGYAAALIRAVAAQIRARGETPFLHSYVANFGANALYERLGFRLRTVLTLSLIERTAA